MLYVFLTPWRASSIVVIRLDWCMLPSTYCTAQLIAGTFAAQAKVAVVFSSQMRLCVRVDGCAASIVGGIAPSLGVLIVG